MAAPTASAPPSGVTAQKSDELRKCGVELLQGFLFSKPISMEEYEEKYLLK